MWFRQSTISEIVERATPVNTTNTGVAFFEDKSAPIPQSTVVQLRTLEEASAISLAADDIAAAVIQRLRGVGGNTVGPFGIFTVHQFTSVGTQPFTIETF